MKKSELKQLIREELQKLNENRKPAEIKNNIIKLMREYDHLWVKLTGITQNIADESDELKSLGYDVSSAQKIDTKHDKQAVKLDKIWHEWKLILKNLKRGS